MTATRCSEETTERLQFGFRIAILSVSTWVLLNSLTKFTFTGLVELLSNYVYLDLNLRESSNIKTSSQEIS
jgi:hypothetical protein